MKDNSISLAPNVRYDLKNVSEDIIKLQLRMKAKAALLFSRKTNERDQNLPERKRETETDRVPLRSGSGLPGKQILDNRIGL